MGVVRLPHGPWKSLLTGKYEGRDVSIYQNPQRDILYVVVDRNQEGKARGLVVTVYRGFFLERGELKILINHVTGSPVGVTKKWKGEIFQFLLVQAGIKYIELEPSELNRTVDEMVNTLNRMEKNILLLGRTLGMVLRPLAITPRHVAAMLFTEPSVVAGLAPFSTPKESPEGSMVLGFTKGGDVAREGMENLRRTVIYGDPIGRRRIFLVILEEFLRNGVNTLIVTDRSNTFGGLKMAGDGSPELKKLGLRPVGFSLEVLQPTIDIATVPPEAFAEVAGVKTATDTWNRIVKLLELHRTDAEKPLDIVEKITGEDMVSLRAGRVLSAVNYYKGELFKRMSYNRFTLLSSTGLGTAYILGVEDPWSYLSLLSYVKGIGESLRRMGKSEGVRFVLMVEGADRIFTRTDNALTRSLVKIVENYKEFGLGWVLEAEKDVYLQDVILAMTETKLGAVGELDVAVRTLVKRPYRMEPRPLLSAIELSSAPEVSSPRALLPGHR